MDPEQFSEFDECMKLIEESNDTEIQEDSDTEQNLDSYFPGFRLRNESLDNNGTERSNEERRDIPVPVAITSQQAVPVVTTSQQAVPVMTTAQQAVSFTLPGLVVNTFGSAFPNNSRTHDASHTPAIPVPSAPVQSSTLHQRQIQNLLPAPELPPFNFTPAPWLDQPLFDQPSTNRQQQPSYHSDPVETALFSPSPVIDTPASPRDQDSSSRATVEHRQRNRSDSLPDTTRSSSHDTTKPTTMANKKTKPVKKTTGSDEDVSPRRSPSAAAPASPLADQPAQTSPVVKKTTQKKPTKGKKRKSFLDSGSDDQSVADKRKRPRRSQRINATTTTTTSTTSAPASTTPASLMAASLLGRGQTNPPVPAPAPGANRRIDNLAVAEARAVAMEAALERAEGAAPPAPPSRAVSPRTASAAAVLASLGGTQQQPTTVPAAAAAAPPPPPTSQQVRENLLLTWPPSQWLPPHIYGGSVTMVDPAERARVEEERREMRERAGLPLPWGEKRRKPWWTDDGAMQRMSRYFVVLREAKEREKKEKEEKGEKEGEEEGEGEE